MEATQVLPNKRMDNQNVIYIVNEIEPGSPAGRFATREVPNETLLSFKKEENSDICYNMDKT